MLFRPIYRCLPGICLAAVALGSTCVAQTPAAQQTPPSTAQAASATSPEIPAAPKLPPSLLDQPAEAAKVVFASGQLTIEAHNSSLTQILHQLSASSGMKVDGIAHDQRVFGAYGPGNPREILSDLLEGAGYNVMMVGTTKAGTPSHLELSARSNAPLPAPSPAAANEPEEVEQEPPQAPVNPKPMPPPPQQPSTPSPGARNPNGTIKTPMQILQELEQMRSQQSQQQQ